MSEETASETAAIPEAGSESAPETSEASTQTTETTETTETSAPASISDALARASAAESGQSADQESGETTASESEGAADSSDDQSSTEEPSDEYEPFTLPEGFELSEEDTAEFVELFKAKEFSQEDAQSFMDKMTGYVSERFLPGILEKQEGEYAEQKIRWLEQAKSIPLLSGEKGEAFNQSLQSAGRILGMIENSKEVQDAKLDFSVTDTLTEMGWLEHAAGLILLKIVGDKTYPDQFDERAPGGSLIEDWDNTPPHLRTGWDENAEPIRGKRAE